MLRVSEDWKDYKIIDAGEGEKLESWNGILLRRPDPQAIWNTEFDHTWTDVSGHYIRSQKGGGYWDFKKKIPESWQVQYKDLVFKVSPTNFKHTGLFPEQAINWDFMMDKIRKADRPIKVLNLFAYTGAATMACAKAGAVEVVHVDAAKGMIEWAKENMVLSNLENNKIRFIVDDCLKFVQREARRGHVYDGIIMDPPSYGRGPNGEVWKFEQNIYHLIEESMKILSDKPLFFTINSYTTGISSIVLENILKRTFLPKYPDGKISAGEVALPIVKDSLYLPCGIYGRWES
ncbi:MAG: class I SAM-dependent methyltransferase [Bacilli bacterium]|nr:class I SAM-dependent methyltransferase [Bacilli bacterium]